MFLTCRETDTRHIFTFPEKPAGSQPTKRRGGGFGVREETTLMRQKGRAVKPPAGSGVRQPCPCAQCG